MDIKFAHITITSVFIQAMKIVGKVKHFSYIQRLFLIIITQSYFLFEYFVAHMCISKNLLHASNKFELVLNLSVYYFLKGYIVIWQKIYHVK